MIEKHSNVSATSSCGATYDTDEESWRMVIFINKLLSVKWSTFHVTDTGIEE